MGKANKKQKKKPTLSQQRRAAAGAKGGIAKAAVRARCPLVDNEMSTYGALLMKRGDGTRDRDHIPSFGGLVQYFQTVTGNPPTPKQRAAIKLRGLAIVLPKYIHKQGRTYGGKNTLAQRILDGQDPVLAARADVQAYLGITTKKTKAVLAKMVKPLSYYTNMMNEINNNPRYR